jgi:hypothetical protein
MPTDLTGSNISDIYTSLLHVSSNQLSATLTPVYDGKGNKSTLSISTTSVSISNLQVNGISYPQSIGAAQSVVVSDGVGSFNTASLVSVLSNINSTIPVNGIYSAPVITIENNIVSSIVSSRDNKTFFYPTRTSSQAGPSREQLLSVTSWNSPITGDKMNVLQKITNGSTLVDIAINVFTYSASGWGNPVTY